MGGGGGGGGHDITRAIVGTLSVMEGKYSGREQHRYQDGLQPRPMLVSRC